MALDPVSEVSELRMQEEPKSHEFRRFQEADDRLLPGYGKIRFNRIQTIHFVASAGLWTFLPDMKVREFPNEKGFTPMKSQSNDKDGNL